MSIGLENQYLFEFSLGNNKDFIEEADLVKFTLVEEAGNVLPTFALTFNTQDSTIYHKLHEGQKFNVAFGKDRGTLTSSPLAIMTFDDQQAGASKRLITMTGFYAATPYLNDTRVFISDKKSGLEVVRDVASKYFSVQSTVVKSLDSQRWVQPNITDRNFVNEMYMHSNLGESFPVVGISSDGQFILKDVKADAGKPYKWRFVRLSQDARDIIYDADPYIKAMPGFVNSWVGYGRERVVYDMEGAVDAAVTSVPKSVLAQTGASPGRQGDARRFEGVGPLTENMHPNYWNSYQHNLAQLASLLGVTIGFSFQNKFISVRVLDFAHFGDSTPEAKSSESGEAFTGACIVKKVARTVMNRQFVTVVELARESVNQVSV